MPDKDAIESPESPGPVSEQDETGSEEQGASAPEPQAGTEQDGPQADRSGDSSAAEQEEKPKQSPAEAFAEMRDTVTQLRIDVTELYDFTKITRDKLLKEADEYREEGLRPALEAMIRLHTLVFRQIVAMEAGAQRPDDFLAMLFKAIEGEFVSMGIEIVRPQPGDEVDLELMNTLGMVQCPFWRKPDRVAQVNSCGFVLDQESGSHVLKKAEVTVYRR